MRPLVRSLGGLRARVALLTTLVACASVLAVAWYAGRVSANAWRRQLTPTPPGTLARIARDVADAVGPGAPDWRAAQPVLAAGSASTGKQLIVFDSTRRAVAAAPIELMALDVTLGADGVVTWQRLVREATVPSSGSAPPTRAIVRQRVLVGNPRGAPIVRRAGAAPATLVEISAPLAVDVVSEPPIVRMLRRPMLVGVGVAIVGALLVALILSARVAAPIEQLTRAARSLASGDGTRTQLAVAETGSIEVAELARAFNGMVAELGRQETLRRGMTSDIAHELRTPLTNIRCQIESMLDGLESPSQAVLTSLHEECLGLQQLIDDLQDMAYGDQGRLSLTIEPIDAVAELEGAVRPFQQRAAVVGTTVCVDAPLGVPSVAADRRRFRQIVGNLLSNALTHTAGGTITVSARPAERDVTFEVRDTGVGIAAADLPNVFERFYRADPARARSGGGTGLGLSIVKQLVELHGGSVSIDSALGKGTTVRFTLPGSDSNHIVRTRGRSDDVIRI
ncbi:MAG TPA: HAMP domain-containing sensor histidine kinase [Gemmatimonadaceae bacterium]|nr:HAMP domain-containing sensor histidine kinase [Gemmatimonadaceae bacterium]